MKLNLSNLFLLQSAVLSVNYTLTVKDKINFFQFHLVENRLNEINFKSSIYEQIRKSIIELDTFEKICCNH